MSRKIIYIVAPIFMLVLLISAPHTHAQDSVKPITLVYSNNINGEIESCPT